MKMHASILHLLESLSLSSTSPQNADRSGFLLGMVVERNSWQKSPESFYREVLPEPYVSIALQESEYRYVVMKAASLLGLSSTPPSAQGALLFVLGGTDGRTLELVIPALVRFLDHNIGGANYVRGVATLKRMLSSPEQIQTRSSAILDGIRKEVDIEDLIKRNHAAAQSEAAAILQRLKDLIREPLAGPAGERTTS